MSHRSSDTENPLILYEYPEDDTGASNAPVTVRRRRKAPLWKKLRAFCIVLLFLGLVECGAGVLTAPTFSIKKIHVRGVQESPAAQVDKLAQQLVGHNWVRLHSKNIVRSLEKIPTVDHVRIHRTITWPPQLEAKVVITERQPYVLVGNAGRWWAVDKKGVPFRQVKSPDAMREKAPLNAISDPTFRPVAGKTLPAAQWKRMARLLQTLEEDQLAHPRAMQWNLRRIHFDRTGNASLRLKNPGHEELLVQLGANQWGAKLKRARQALAYLDSSGREASVINLISYKIPTWVPRVGTDSQESASSGDAVQG